MTGIDASAADALVVRSDGRASEDPALLYLASLGSERSRMVMRSRLNIFAGYLGLADWRQIPWPQMDRAWLLLAKTKMSSADAARAPSTINGMLALLKGIAAQAWDYRQIDNEAYLRIKQTPGVRGRRVPKRRLLATEDVRTLLDHCLADDRLQGQRDAALLGMLYGCGLRRSEVVGINYEDLDLTQRAVVIRGKGNKERRVYPPARAWELLEEWLIDARGSGSGGLFCRIRKGGHLTRDRLTDQAVYYLIERMVRLTGMETFSPHDLRGSFISYLLDREDLKTVADLVGHADLSTTAGYDRRPEKNKERANRLVEL